MRARRRLVLATANPHKAAEIRRLLADLPMEILTLEDFPGVELPPETGSSFAENAVAKAEAVARATGLWALGDDSGLEVEALHGRPGVYSKRFAGPDATDRENNARLLECLRDVPKERRAARFVCVAALARPGEPTLLVRGEVEGRILTEPRGHGGFGYDSLFFHPPSGKTFAELAPEEKNRVSHRGRALAALRAELIRLLAREGGPPRLASLLEYAQAVILALAMALVLRQFVVEAFKIPTPSMAPTLQGEPGGDRILVDKVIYRLRPPHRWEVIVFRYPLDQRVNYIKRLIGLPGETVEIRDGDVFINGAVARKPWRLQRHLWIPLYPECLDPYTAPGDLRYGLPGQFEQAPTGSPLAGSVWEGFPGPGRQAELRYAFQPGLPALAFHRREARYEAPAFSGTPYRDLRFVGELQLAGPTGAAAVVLTTRGVQWRVWFRAAAPGAAVVGRYLDRHLYAPPLKGSQPGRGRTLPPGRWVRVSVAHWDYTFEVRVDDEVWFRFLLSPCPATVASRLGPTRLSVLLADGGGRWRDLSVARDLHYTTNLAGYPYRYDVPPGHFFVLGDNSRNSKDSRRWRKVIAPLRDGGVVEFDSEQQDPTAWLHGEREIVDVLGNRHAAGELAAAGRRRLVAAPFVPADLLVGRAVLIFYPLCEEGRFRIGWIH